jgi:hypothetical protein
MFKIGLQNFKCRLTDHRCAALLQFYQIGYAPGGVEKCVCLHFLPHQKGPELAGVFKPFTDKHGNLSRTDLPS